ncbi:hypothetical protein Cni_G29332 [Canna indica]|uniref:Senescence regulator n=1 Tax=Canna indica TaxID=4628 RepID=A0AAQ3L718_9LILI|nr:hypothetical protein Cni_G29332 [Canna indica]
MEELREADILWPENDGCSKEEANSVSQSKIAAPGTENKKVSNPVKIPSNFVHSTSYNDYNDDDDDCSTIPPHVIVARRMTGKMAFSVCSGNGRTLKGRDLSQVRNSILHMTGFLERHEDKSKELKSM